MKYLYKYPHEASVGKRRLGVLVEVLHVGVGRGRIDVEVVLLHVLAVIPLAAREPEEALLEDRIAAVPERQRQAEPSVVVGDPGDPVLAPPVRPRSGMVVGEGVPGRPKRAVVLANGPPLALGQVRPPPLPVGRAVLGFVESQLFPCHGLSCAQSLDTRQGPSGAARATGGPGHGGPLWRPWTGAIWR